MISCKCDSTDITLNTHTRRKVMLCLRSTPGAGSRSVSTQTGINVNTVKRAFADLEDEGIIYSLVGRGSFVASDAANNTSIAEKALKDIEPDLYSLKSKGVDRDSVIKLINKIYEEE